MARLNFIDVDWMFVDDGVSGEENLPLTYPQAKLVLFLLSRATEQPYIVFNRVLTDGETAEVDKALNKCQQLFTSP